MGLYIQGPVRGKVHHILTHFNAMELDGKPEQFNKDDELALICVIDNGGFEAALWVENDREWAVVNNPDQVQGRKQTWIYVDKREVLAYFKGDK